jgi:hypothetical protein
MTGIPDIELEVQRKLTEAYINTMPVVLILIPRAEVRNSSGGTILVEQAPREPQTMRFIEYTTQYGEGPEPNSAPEGKQRLSQYEIQAKWDAVMDVNDIFTYENDRWEIIELYYFNGWEKRARVWRYGGNS